jgi:hypothetical protein
MYVTTPKWTDRQGRTVWYEVNQTNTRTNIIKHADDKKVRIFTVRHSGASEAEKANHFENACEWATRQYNKQKGA